MTNEEAIKDIKGNIKPYVGGISLDMAIEALENQKSIEELGECYIIPKNGTWEVNGIDVHEALEKQIPQKPILKSGQSVVHINKGDEPHEWKVNRWEEWCCPVCGWFVGERFNRIRNDGSIHPHDQKKSNYCNECGQAIDWSDDNV